MTSTMADDVADGRSGAVVGGPPAETENIATAATNITPTNFFTYALSSRN
jgi:hypothetical protein